MDLHITKKYREDLPSGTGYFLQYIHNRVYNENKNMLIAIIGPTGCQPSGNKVLMADGSWKNIEEIKIGNIVLSPQKDKSFVFAVVKNITSFFCDNVFNIVELNKTKQKLYSCSSNHIIPFYHRFKKRGTKNGKRYLINEWQGFKEYEVEQLSLMSKKQRGHTNIAFTSFPVPNFLDRINCEIEPYTLGVFLGDGMFRYCVRNIINKDYNVMKRSDKKEIHRKINSRLMIESSNQEIINKIVKFYGECKVYTKRDCLSKSYDWGLNSLLAKHLEKYGLKGVNSGTKFIPKEAMLSDLEYRKKLLAGLIDTDGYYRNGGYSFILKSRRLIEDIRDLVYSLGGRCCKIKKVTKKIKSSGFIGEYYSLSVYLNDLKLPIINQHKIKDIKSIYLDSNRIAIDLKQSKPCMVYGFELDSPSGWYITDNWMVTHNSGKSWSGLTMMEELDKEYRKENVCFRALEFMDRLNSGEMKKGVVVIWDESGIDLNAKQWQSLINRVINYILQTFRHENLIVIFTVPYLSFLDSDSRKLLHCILKTKKIDKKTQTTVLQPLLIQVNDETGKAYRKHLRVLTPDGYMSKVTRIRLRKPSEEFRNWYEAQKIEFSKKLRQEIRDKLLKQKLKEFVDPLKGYIIGKKERMANDLYDKYKNQSEVARIMGIDEKQVRNYLKSMPEKLKMQEFAKENGFLGFSDVSDTPERLK